MSVPESIPSQLAKEYKKFQFSKIRPNARGKELAGSIQWIEDAGIIQRCYNIQATELPLDGNRISNEFKIYMADIGPLTSMLEDGTQASILQGKLFGLQKGLFSKIL